MRILSWAGPRAASASPRPTTCCAKPGSVCRSSARLLVNAREAARAIWRAALAAGDVAPLLRARLRLHDDTLSAGDVRVDLGDHRQIGRASCRERERHDGSAGST